MSSDDLGDGYGYQERRGKGWKQREAIQDDLYQDEAVKPMSEFKCSAICHYMNSRHRISFIAEIVLPFVPFNGMLLTLVEDEPAVTVTEVNWNIVTEDLCICGDCELDWAEPLFRSLMESFKEFNPELYDYTEETP